MFGAQRRFWSTLVTETQFEARLVRYNATETAFTAIGCVDKSAASRPVVSDPKSLAFVGLCRLLKFNDQWRKVFVKKRAQPTHQIKVLVCSSSSVTNVFGNSFSKLSDRATDISQLTATRINKPIDYTHPHNYYPPLRFYYLACASFIYESSGEVI